MPFCRAKVMPLSIPHDIVIHFLYGWKRLCSWRDTQSSNVIYRYLCNKVCGLKLALRLEMFSQFGDTPFLYDVPKEQLKYEKHNKSACADYGIEKKQEGVHVVNTDPQDQRKQY